MLASNESYLNKLLTDDRVSSKKLATNKYLIKKADQEWILYPLSGSFFFAKDGVSVGVKYFGADVKEFYQRFILEIASIPRNTGKTWEADEDSSIVEMIEDGMSVNEIADYLERGVFSVQLRIAKLLDFDGNFKSVFLEMQGDDLFHPVLDFIAA